MPLPGGLQAFREMLEASLAEPHREQAGNAFRSALNRSLGKGKSAPVRQANPEFPTNSIFDYSDFGADPMGYLQRKDIALPQTQRGLEAVLPPFRSPNKMHEILNAANLGASQGGHLWYNTAPIFDFANKYAPEADVHQFLRIGAPFSAQTAVDKEIKQGAFANYFLQKYGRLPEADEMMDAETTILGGGGSIADKLQWAKEAIEGGGLKAPMNARGELAGKAKLVPYEEARKGNRWNAVMDTWMLRGLGMNPGSAPPKKGGAELGMKLLAERAGMTPSQFQAAAWTGMQGSAKPYAQILEDLVSQSAENLEKGKEQHMIDVLSGKDYIRDQPANFAEGGLAQYIRHRLMQESQRASYPAMQQKLEGWARESITDPFGVAPSGRKALALGRDKVIKLVGGHARGLREQQLEGEPFLAGQYSIPALHWRSPNEEMTVTERIPNTKREIQKRFMQPLENMYGRAREDYPSSEWSTIHQTDPEIRDEMQKRGLDPFFNYELLGGDFFRPDHWGFRGTGPMVNSRSGVLLDVGAIEPRLVGGNIRQQFLPQMRDIGAMRKSFLESKGVDPYEMISNRGWVPDMEKMIFAFPDATNVQGLPRVAAETRPDLQGKLGFADGGKVSMRLARAAAMLGRLDDSEPINSYAGGGQVRNFLRGVPGSGIDEVLKGLRDRYPVISDAHYGEPRQIMPGQRANLIDLAPRNKAMQAWIDRNLGNYMVRQLGTEDDPLKEHLRGEINNVIRRIPAAQVPERIMGDLEPLGLDTPLAKWKKQAPAWLQKLVEQDMPRAQKSQEIIKGASDALHNAGGDSDAVRKATEAYNQAMHAGSLGDYKFDGLPDPVWLHDIDKNNWDRFMREPTQGMMDFLAQHYTPEQLPKVSVPDAMKGSIAWHEALAKKKAEAMENPWIGTSVHKEYPTGFKWVKFGLDEKGGMEGGLSPAERLRLGLEQEGNQMGHCVGGYCDDVMNESSHIYSLRDPQGQPHVTVEVNPGEEIDPRDRAAAKALYGDRLSLPSINQIKGKADKKPADQYLPYVQDFVRSGKWGDVGDLQNTGLIQVKPWENTGINRGPIYGTRKELEPFRQYLWQKDIAGKENEWLPEDELTKRALASPTDPRAVNMLGQRRNEEGMRAYLRGLDESLQGRAWQYRIPEDWQPTPPKFEADGGPVKKPDPQPEGMTGVRGYSDEDAAGWLLDHLSEEIA